MKKENSNLEFRKIKSLKFLYEVNENGTIFRNVKSKKQLKIKLFKHHSKVGYYMVTVHIGGHNANPKRVMIHQAVAECWLGDRPEGYQIDHIDRNPHNNDYRNLRYVTISEQMKNRDHSNIIINGSRNLEEARRGRMKPIIFKKENEIYKFESFSEASRRMSELLSVTFESIRSRLKAGRKIINGFSIEYLNAETGHDNSKE